MRTIYKYPLTLEARPQIVSMPAGSRVVRFDRQGQTFVFWALVDTDRPAVSRRFQIRGTGHDVGDSGAYLGTAFSGDFVWHLFDLDGAP